MQTEEIEVRKLEVYDPRSDGISLRDYRRIYSKAHEISPEFAYVVRDGLTQRLKNSRIGTNGQTLGQALNILLSQPHFVGLIFMDGKCHSSYDSREEMQEVDIDVLAEESNAVPFPISNDPTIAQDLRERRATEMFATP